MRVQFGSSSSSSSRDVVTQLPAAGAAASVAYRQGANEDVITDRNSRSYVTLY